MKTRSLLLLSAVSLLVGAWPSSPAAADEGLERRVLRQASGIYGPEDAGIPTGTFIGKVGYEYNEHSTVKLTLRPGRGASSAVLNVWSGSPHIVRIAGITAKVKPGGRSVVLSGGRLKGSGLLPYGVKVKRLRIKSATVKVGAKPSLAADLGFAGIDLANMNAPVSGSAEFKGRQ